MEELNRLSKEEAKSSGHFPIVILLDDVRSMHNVGSAFRTADAFAVEKMVLCGYTPQPPHRDIHKTALGATDTVAWHYEQDISAVLAQLKEEGYKLFAIEQAHNSIALQDFKIASKEEKMAFVFGNEVSGVSDAALVLCDGCVEIPQWGSKHSLNISVTVGIVLWEAVKNNAGL